MALFNTGAMIHELRKAKGLTQAQLAEGICARQTVTAIEKGERKPDWFTFKLIMRKLDVNPDNYFNDIASADDIFVRQQLQKCDKLLLSFDWDALKIEHDKMEKDKRFAKGEGHRIFLGLKANFFNQGKYQNPQLAIDASIERLKMSRTDFDLQLVSTYILTFEEQMALNSLATAYYNLGEHGKCIDIRKNIAISFEQNNEKSLNDAELSFHYFIVVTGLCLNLKDSQRYEECIIWADKAIKLYSGSHNTVFFMRITRYKAFSLLKLGQREEGEKLYIKALLYANIFDEYIEHNFELAKTEFEENFGYKLDLSVSW